MQITAIKRRRRGSRRVNVYLDGVYGFSVTEEVAVRARLRAGDMLDDGAIAELQADDLAVRAKEAALMLLSHRPRTARELEQRLIRKAYPPDVVAICVAGMMDANLVDDRDFARAFVRDRIRSRPKGRRALVAEMERRGIDPTVAVEALREVLDDQETTEADLALNAARRFRARAGEDPSTRRRRLYGFLARRGFDADVIRVVVDGG